MFKITALLAVLLLAFATPALADSITPPVMSVAFSGVIGGVIFYSPTSYVGGGSNMYLNNGCLQTCTEFEVQNGVFTGRSTINFAQVAYVIGTDVGGELFGHLGKVSFNAQTDTLSAVFGGKEQMETLVAGKWYPESWYTVQGTFTDNLSTGAGSVNLTSETYIGTSPVPEPETLIMLGTGLCAIAGVLKRKLMAPAYRETIVC
ncbi:MAG: PEP-CTERM sorting domain-containing protein [Candidatus Sulfotelmatobacter sp.]